MILVIAGQSSRQSSIIGEGDINDQVRYAIRCVCGEDRIILSVDLVSQHLRQPFPEGAKQYMALSRERDV